MKNLILFLLFFKLFTGYSQWSVGNYIDEAGNETESTFEYQTITGQYSNSMVECSKCVFFIEHNKKAKALGISIYPFGEEQKEEWGEDTFQDFHLITPKGKLIKIETFCFDGMLFFIEKEYKQLKRAIKQKGMYQVYCDFEDGKSITSYAFNFEN